MPHVRLWYGGTYIPHVRLWYMCAVGIVPHFGVTRIISHSVTYPILSTGCVKCCFQTIALYRPLLPLFFWGLRLILMLFISPCIFPLKMTSAFPDTRHCYRILLGRVGCSGDLFSLTPGIPSSPAAFSRQSVRSTRR